MIAFTGASFSINFSNLSERSKTTTILKISTIEKKKVPRNFLIIYKSNFFILR